MITEEKKYLNGWKGLSDFLGGVSRSTLVKWEKEGKFNKYHIGGKVFFKSEEIEKAFDK